MADNWLALLALLVALVGGLPGALQALEFFRPVVLVGSVKYFAPTRSPSPPESGLLLAITLFNEGRRSLVWKKVTGSLALAGEEIAMDPRWIPDEFELNGQSPRPDLLSQQSIPPGAVVNAYLLLVTSEEVSADLAESTVKLRFETESGRVVELALSLDVGGPVPGGVRFPSHPGIGF